ncbi:MAG: DUF4252 domain-containing protein [Saprospiraceae bacterium]|nr:DUF4252 domain-containing protein [Saprospiraceae bacterium]
MQVKSFIAVLFMLFTVQISSAQISSLDKFFNKHQEDPLFTVVTISPKLFQMFAKLDLDEESEDVKEMIQQITSLRILARDSMDGTKLYQDAFTQLTSSEFEELITVRDGSENVRFLIREDGSEVIKQLVLLVGGSDSFVLLDITGNIDLKNIGKLGKALDIPGGEHLEKVGTE